MTTTAQTIADLLDNDGQMFETADSRTLEDLCDEHARRDYENRGISDAAERWVFDDGSVITSHGHAWAEGYADCWCWSEAGHVEECEAV